MALIPLNKPHIRQAFLALLAILVLLSACTSAAAQPNNPVSTALAVQAQSATEAAGRVKAAPTAVPSATATAQPAKTLLLSSKLLPAALQSQIRLPGGWIKTDQPEKASVTLGPLAQPQPGAVQWVYALVAPFPTVADEVKLADLTAAWKASAVTGQPFQKLLVDRPTAAAFTAVWGQPGGAVTIATGGSLVEIAWQMKTTWAIVPFEQLEPRWKVIAVDGQSPVRKEFDLDRYPLTVNYGLTGSTPLIAAFDPSKLPASNRQADHLTTLVLTGTTALVRGTASFMEGRGLDYPARDIGPWLKSADILHVSNEVAFDPKCPPPFDWQDLKFCSRPKYIQLLQDIGVKVIELTGDHFADWSVDAMRYTLDLYKKDGFLYYGGGTDIEDAKKPAIIEHNGNKFAFIGCNAKGKGYATASETSPGALHCDMDWMVAETKKLKSQGYIPIVTFQHEEYYQFIALPELQKDFQAVADAGAVLVSGSQAHQPQAFEIRGKSFIHYGLGNLFFDQTNQGEPPRWEFIDRHVFYEGKHISTELLTAYLEDYARPRPMTPEERKNLLETIFKASGW